MRKVKRSQICDWVVADLNFELSNQRRTTFVDYVNYDTQCTYIENVFIFIIILCVRSKLDLELKNI